MHDEGPAHGQPNAKLGVVSDGRRGKTKKEA